jgi:hypothetical protein
MNADVAAMIAAGNTIWPGSARLPHPVQESSLNIGGSLVEIIDYTFNVA